MITVVAAETGTRPLFHASLPMHAHTPAAAPHLHVQWQLVHVTKDGHPRISQPRPPRHLHHQGAARVLNQVARVDGQRAEAEDRQPGPITGKVHQGAEGVAGAPAARDAARREACLCGHMSAMHVLYMCGDAQAAIQNV
jgi:hypothetical protein